jgi:hypothetical protein
MTPQDQPPAPTESALRYAIALCNGRLDVEAPYHAAIIAGYVATLERLLQPPPEPPAPTLRALIEQAIVKHFYEDEGPRIGPGRVVRCKFCCQGGTVGGTLATGYQHTLTCWVPAFNADLAALLTETDEPRLTGGHNCPKCGDNGCLAC